MFSSKPSPALLHCSLLLPQGMAEEKQAETGSESTGTDSAWRNIFR